MEKQVAVQPRSAVASQGARVVIEQEVAHIALVRNLASRNKGEWFRWGRE